MSVCLSFYTFELNCWYFRAKPITYSESVWAGGAALAIHFPEKLPVAKLPKKGYAANAFLWLQINLGFTQFQSHDWPLIPKKQNCPETELPEPSDPPGVRIPPIVTSGHGNEQLPWERTGISRGWTSGLLVKIGRSRVTESSLLYILPVLLKGPTSSN
jgi:hypothetical protein